MGLAFADIVALPGTDTPPDASSDWLPEEDAPHSLPESFWFEAEERGLFPPVLNRSRKPLPPAESRLETVADEMARRQDYSVRLPASTLKPLLDRLAESGRIAVVATEDAALELPTLPSTPECLESVQSHLHLQESRIEAHGRTAACWATILENLQRRQEISRTRDSLRAGLRDRNCLRDRLEKLDDPPVGKREADAELATLQDALKAVESAVTESRAIEEARRLELERLRKQRPWHLGYWFGGRSRRAEWERQQREKDREREGLFAETARLQLLLRPAEERRNAFVDAWIDAELASDEGRLAVEEARLNAEMTELRAEGDRVWDVIATAVGPVGPAPATIEELRELQVEAGCRAEAWERERAWARGWLQTATRAGDAVLERHAATAACWKISRAPLTPRIERLFDSVLHCEAGPHGYRLRKGTVEEGTDEPFRREADALVARLEPSASNLRREPLLDNPGVLLGFLPDGLLAEVRFPAETPVAVAKAMLAEQLDWRTLNPVSDRYRVLERDDRILLRFRDSPEPACFAWGDGVCEMLDGGETVSVSFARSSGWTVDKARAWIEPRLQPARSIRCVALD